MRFLAVAPAEDSRRFVKGYPPRGAWLFLEPDLDISRLATIVEGTDRIDYIDLRVEELAWEGEVDLCLVRIDLDQEEAGHELLSEFRTRNIRTLAFGPLPTRWDGRPPAWLGSYVVGDIANAWPQVRADIESGRLAGSYTATPEPRYIPARRPFGRWPEMNCRQQVISFVVGCSCPKPVQDLCPARGYYGERLHVRSREEIIGEVMDLPHKHVRLLDEDVARFPEYYLDLFRELWNYRRHWTVSAGAGLFNSPRLIRLLAKAGTRLVMFNDSFLGPHIARATTDPATVRALYRRVKLIQSRKMLVGARLSINLDPGHELDWAAVAAVLRRIDLDLLELLAWRSGDDGRPVPIPTRYEPMLSPGNPAWVRGRFYALGVILDRLARRPRRTGFYTTARYLLPYSLAYRQNYLEGIARP